MYSVPCDILKLFLKFRFIACYQIINGLHQNFNIHPQALVFHVFHINLQSFLEAEKTSAVYLGQTYDARLTRVISPPPWMR
jgi:hypothetical protein